MGAYESPYDDYNNTSTFVVKNTNDVANPNDALYTDSLRWAIDKANTSGSKALITFAPSVCPNTIKLNSPLPDVYVPLKIDGYSATGSAPNTDPGLLSNAHLCVVVRPANVNAYPPFALRVPPGASNASLTVQGLSIGGFVNGIELWDGTTHQIIGNRFGFTSGFSNLGFLSAGVRVETSSPVIIGGSNPGDRNVFLNAYSSDNSEAGAVTIGYGTAGGQGSCQIVGNLFGISPDGTFADPNNENGILIQGTGCSVVGNYLAGNTHDAIRLMGGSHNVIQNNTIGPKITPGGSPFQNPGAGIRLTNGANDNIIGTGEGFYGPVASYQNNIRTMNGGGIVVSGSTGNTIRGNATYANGVAPAMNIDLGADGPTANDPGDADGGPDEANDLMNYPVPHSVAFVSGGLGFIDMTVRGQLDAQAGTYWIDAYYDTECSPTGRGGGTWVGGQTYLGLFTGMGAFEVPVSIPFFSYDSAKGRISLTATSTDEHPSTSEFSECLSIDTIFSDGMDR